MEENNTFNTEPIQQPEQPVYPDPVQNKPFDRFRSDSHIWIGGLLVLIGGLFLFDRLGFNFPDWLFSFEMLLIVIGVFIGVRKQFQGVGWLILILIGSLLLINHYFVFGELRKFIVPLTLIGAGLFFIFRQRKSYDFLDKNNPVLPGEMNNLAGSGQPTAEDFIESTSIFGGAKKKVFSKNFRGANIVAIFGGSDVDLTQADTNGTALIEATIIFGGGTILVPSNWNVVSNAVTIFGDVKDKRSLLNNMPVQGNKTLIIRGTVMFGGIDVKSF